MPGFADITVTLARNDVIAAQLYGFRVWPLTFQFTLFMIVNPSLPPASAEMYENPIFSKSHTRGNPAVASRLFEMGVVFPDGSRGSNLTWMEQHDGPGLPLLSGDGGGGVGGCYQYNWKVWPLPMPGLLKFWCDWPYYGMAPCWAEVDAQPILDAASQAARAWETTPGNY